MPDSALKTYEKEIVTRMDAVWRRLSSQHSDQLAVGTIKIQFRVQADGRLSHLKIRSNSGNEALANIALRTVKETQIPPIPDTALAELPNRYDTCDFNFAVYPPR